MSFCLFFLFVEELGFESEGFYFNAILLISYVNGSLMSFVVSLFSVLMMDFHLWPFILAVGFLWRCTLMNTFFLLWVTVTLFINIPWYWSFGGCFLLSGFWLDICKLLLPVFAIVCLNILNQLFSLTFSNIYKGGPTKWHGGAMSPLK